MSFVRKYAVDLANCILSIRKSYIARNEAKRAQESQDEEAARKSVLRDVESEWKRGDVEEADQAFAEMLHQEEVSLSVTQLQCAMI